ncbi:hypothetical protein ACE1CI_38135 [Aerosakkonemataceae cyanobacterium BLCC-F50]|uniref:Uncharacterized protein n=1 Tax=Floridaenema flaviceps BLCC-F50 TaxID=3153642 RepID=A0ABV4Y433_9CYAN
MNRKREDLQRVADVHRANIQRRLEHRLEVARAKGDDNLVQMLEAEMRQM